MAPPTAAKAVDLDPYQTANSLKTTGIEFLRNPNLRNTMTQKKNLMVIAQFEYLHPVTHEPYHVQRSWPCRDQQDAELTVRYYGMKTGSVEARCQLQEIVNEKSQ